MVSYRVAHILHNQVVMLQQALGITYGAASVRHNLVVGYVEASIRYIFVDIVQGQSGGYGVPSMVKWLYA